MSPRRARPRGADAASRRTPTSAGSRRATCDASCEWIAEAIREAGAGARAARGTGRRRSAPALAVDSWRAGALGLESRVGLLPRRLPRPLRGRLRWSRPRRSPPSENRPLESDRPSLALSPDGATVAFVAHEGESTAVRRSRASRRPRRLGGTRARRAPSFRPTASGSASSPTASSRRSPSPAARRWRSARRRTPRAGPGAEDDRSSSTRMTRGLSRVSAAGGKTEALTRSTPSRASARTAGPSSCRAAARALHDRSWPRQPRTTSQIAFLDRRRARRRPLLEGDLGRYVPTGHLLYVRGAALVRACPSTPSAPKVTGAAIAGASTAIAGDDERLGPDRPVRGTARWSTFPARR